MVLAELCCPLPSLQSTSGWVGLCVCLGGGDDAPTPVLMTHHLHAGATKDPSAGAVKDPSTGGTHAAGAQGDTASDAAATDAAATAAVGNPGTCLGWGAGVDTGSTWVHACCVCGWGMMQQVAGLWWVGA